MGFLVNHFLSSSVCKCIVFVVTKNLKEKKAIFGYILEKNLIELKAYLGIYAIVPNKLMSRNAYVGDQSRDLHFVHKNNFLVLIPCH